MRRRRSVLQLVGGAVVAGLSGCLGSEDGSDDRFSDGDPEDVGTVNGEEIDAGLVYEGQLDGIREWGINVVQEQAIRVHVDGIEEGERFDWEIRNRHYHQFHGEGFLEGDSGTRDIYEFEEDGFFVAALWVTRTEEPLDRPVTVDVTLELSYP